MSSKRLEWEFKTKMGKIESTTVILISRREDQLAFRDKKRLRALRGVKFELVCPVPNQSYKSNKTGII